MGAGSGCVCVCVCNVMETFAVCCAFFVFPSCFRLYIWRIVSNYKRIYYSEWNDAENSGLITHTIYILCTYTHVQTHTQAKSLRSFGCLIHSSIFCVFVFIRFCFVLCFYFILVGPSILSSPNSIYLMWCGWGTGGLG